MSDTAPDVATRHILVTHTQTTGRLLDVPYPVPVPAGTVLWVGALGKTQIEHIGPAVPLHPTTRAPVAVLIEHGNAKVGDVLPASEVAAGIATAQVK